MERLLYMLNREWPRKNNAVRMFERICTFVAVESFKVIDHEKSIEINTEVLPKFADSVWGLAEHIMQKTLP